MTVVDGHQRAPFSIAATTSPRPLANTLPPRSIGSIPGHVIPKTLKMVFDTSLLNIQQYKVRIKGKVERSREKSKPSPTLRCGTY